MDDYTYYSKLMRVTLDRLDHCYKRSDGKTARSVITDITNITHLLETAFRREMKERMCKGIVEALEREANIPPERKN